MKIVSVVGARPQFVKAAPVSRQLRLAHREILVHTGQHYDANMSAVFFDELDIPPPDYHLGVGSGPHGAQTGAMIERIEQVLTTEVPDWVLVYGDTNSTLAGALAAAKLHVPVAHVEAGLRSYNRRMPEEINRLLADHVSSLLLCSSEVGVENLAAEGITNGVHVVGDVMADALQDAVRASNRSNVLDRLGLGEGGYFVATVHRAENTDDDARLRGIVEALIEVDRPVVFPLHPRTRTRLAELGRAVEERLAGSRVQLVEPVGYLDMVTLERAARLILTDSGGVQKEAYWLGVPCVTLRDETEWVETVELGWNRLAGASTGRILDAVGSFASGPLNRARPTLYGDGAAAGRIVRILESGL
ncbi:MAG: UDP-N-acetylglucosamine 2-epimerase (non-hydrolyzing) [Anaerolineae bacterium]|nr:UDP-N-acetylglucosamine 2-epimerase (non-hydrolyzing) [Anaerolineae bacterium]